MNTKKSEHTPGPWLVCGNQRAGGHFDFVLPQADNKDFQANCRLISSAPELLALLQEALTALNTAPRFNVGKTTSYNIAGKIERIIKKVEDK
jgi:hypothetical protein